MAGKKYTIRRVHVGGCARVHDPGVGVLECHLVQGGNETSQIPHLKGGDLRRGERCVSLGVGAEEPRSAPALAAMPEAAGLLTRGTLGGVRVEAEPGSHGAKGGPLRDALLDAGAGLRATAALAARTVTLAAALAALLLGCAAASTAPALAVTARGDARKGGAATGAGAVGGGGGDESSGRRVLSRRWRGATL